MDKKIIDFKQQSRFDNSNLRLNNVLVRLNQKSSKSQDAVNELLLLVSKAEEVIIIYSNQLVSADLENIVNERFNNGVRCYFLTSENNYKDISKNPFRDLIIRQSEKEINMSFILVDPKINPLGIWSPQPIIKNKFTKFLHLNKEQIKDLYELFVESFWKSNSEIVHGSAPQIKNILISSTETIKRKFKPKSIMNTDLSKIDNKFHDEIKLLTLPRNMQINIEDTLLLESANKIILEPGKFTKQLILSSDNISNEVQLGSVSEMLIETENETWIFTDELGIKLDTTQIQKTMNWIQTGWKYVSEISILELKGDFVPEDQNWGQVNNEDIIRIDNIHNETLEPLVLETMDDWLHEFIAFEKDEIKTEIILQEQIRYAKYIEASRTVIPPTIDKSKSNKHRIYDLWPKFLMQITSSINKTTKIFEDIKSYEKSFKDKASNKLLKDFIKSQSKTIEELTSIKNATNKLLENKNGMNFWDENSIGKNVNKLNDYLEVFLNHTRELGKGIEIQKDKDWNELEALDKSKAKLKGNRKQLVKVLTKFNKINLRELQIDFNSKPPYLPPKIGELWEHNNTNYIIISTIEEINVAKAIASKYENAKLAILR